MEQVMCSPARHDEKFTDKKIFTARIVEEGIVLAAEECFEWILTRQRETGMGLSLTPWMWRLSTA